MREFLPSNVDKWSVAIEVEGCEGEGTQGAVNFDETEDWCSLVRNS